MIIFDSSCLLVYINPKTKYLSLLVSEKHGIRLSKPYRISLKDYDKTKDRALILYYNKDEKRWFK
jgi:hypothetical protein